MLEIIISNKYIIPCPDNYIYQPDILEPISVRFNIDPLSNQIFVVDIKFLSRKYIWNNIKEQLVDEWKDMYISQFEFPIYNRGLFLFNLTEVDRIKYRCIDAASFIAHEYKRRYVNNQHVIYYFINHAEDKVSARIKISSAESNFNNSLDRYADYILIGELKVCETHDRLRWFDYLEIDIDFQNDVSKQTMLRLAVEHLNMNAIPCVKRANAYRFYLTQEEEHLIAECLIKDIIRCEICYFSTNSNYQSALSILSDGAIDPGRNSKILQQLNPPLQAAEVIPDFGSPMGSPLLFING